MKAAPTFRIGVEGKLQYEETGEEEGERIPARKRKMILDKEPSAGEWDIEDRNDKGARSSVSQFKFYKSEETLSRKNVDYDMQPHQVACYSRVRVGGHVYHDDSSLRHFKLLTSQDIVADLNQGFDAFIERKELGSEGLAHLLACIRDKNIPLENKHFVTHNENLKKILATPYIKTEPWETGVHKRKGVIYLDVHKLPEVPRSESDRLRCYWSHAFKSLATQDASRADGAALHHVDANVEFYSVNEAKLGPHCILIGYKIDCCDSTNERRFYVLKTSELDFDLERYEREILLSCWIQALLEGVCIVIGFSDNAGKLRHTEVLSSKAISDQVKSKNCWKRRACLAFADDVLCWLYGTVKDNENYVLQFVSPFDRLELLQADACPDAIK